ncbi:putative AbiEi antitoxin of type IV toxin-antitoxin system [Haloactinopolyspora alba]|uniref:Putative AbiEi antitoxin of type IV toxin-antitoxin system n=1 Tax=Haloactinopolyspora alba TaxID=648780 RepID=A0A2P8DZU1_9ACTN|nr:type IV toxin-antitoxin system AbiEi family antitoxin domain-containing protein [Haloactinopolyspora alba]PSL02731.1 putative AbiEi antitoxin of type IV toxin-antitoxin system [Haloactinopolyspora alba]
MRFEDPPLPADVADLLRRGHGVLGTAEAERLGVTRSRMSRLAGSGRLVRLARGVYADAAAYAAADEWRAFELRSRAFVLACGPRAVVGGWSAAAVWRLPVIGGPPELPSVFVPEGSGAAVNSRYGMVRAAALPRRHEAIVRGCPTTVLPRTVVDVARKAPRADALVMADAALTTRMTKKALSAVLDMEAGWPGRAAAAWVSEHADPYAESPLETLGRLTFIERGLPVPLSNVWVDVGGARYRVDHLLPDRWLVVEGDGALKYDNRPDAGRVVADQREREWRLREAGLDVVRYDWRLAQHQRGQLADRFAHAVAANPVRAEPFPWWRDPQPRERLLV